LLSKANKKVNHYSYKAKKSLAYEQLELKCLSL
jgi:hypothetical protein